MGWMAPASMPESDATTMQRVPQTVPMPAMMPPPGTDWSASGTSCKKPASVQRGSQGAPASSSSATRSRGSSCWRLAKRAADWADASAARPSSARRRSMRDTMTARRSCAGGLAAFQLETNALMGES